MSDKTDLRLMRLDTALGGSADGFYIAADALLADLDAADRAAGIVRVDTSDEALVERLLTALTDEGFEAPMGFARVEDYVTAPSYTAERANQVRELAAADEESSRLNREAVRRAVLAALREES